ncbi:MAG: DUF2281 domain-containing protein [Bacteroidales bacterium]|nr:DUF2281 domain-containing protein [Bacteroidales bacterium]
MNASTLAARIKELPDTARIKVEEYVDFLYDHYHGARKGDMDQLDTKKHESPFFGIWKGRDDMQDSSRWVKSIRQDHWER